MSVMWAVESSLTDSGAGAPQRLWITPAQTTGAHEHSFLVLCRLDLAVGQTAQLA